MPEISGLAPSREIRETLAGARLAPVALQVDFIRLMPGLEALQFKADQAAEDNEGRALTFCVFGEWDLLRLSLTTDLFPVVKPSAIWPSEEIVVRNQHTFLAHLWTPPGESHPVCLEPTSEGLWRFKEEYRGRHYPVQLLTCIKLDPRWTARFGLDVELRVMNWITTKARNRELPILSGGSVGWQELIFLVSADNIQDIRLLLAEIYEASPEEVFGDSVSDDLRNCPLMARTVSYPCVSTAAYLSSSLRQSLTDKSHRTKLLLDLRPGVKNPLPDFLDGKIKGAAGEMLGLHPEALSEEFGEYDLSFNFPPGASFGEALQMIAEIRATNLDPQYRGWLSGTATILDFEPIPRRQDIRPLLPLNSQPRPVGILSWLEKFQRAEQGSVSVSSMYAGRFAAILRRLDSDLQDPVLAESVAPVARYLSTLQRDLSEKLKPEMETDAFEFDQLFSILEFALSQRTEGLQQFLFNSLPTSYYGRGGINRILVGADAILREVWNLFLMTNPGFVVFGVPNHNRFTCFGPIVMVPLPAIFHMEWWWVIYHETAEHLSNTYLGPQPRELGKILPDLLTLALPFRFELDFFARAYAAGINSIPPKDLRRHIPSIGIRIATLHLLGVIYRTHRGSIEEVLGQGTLRTRAQLGALAELWKTSLLGWSRRLAEMEALPDELSACVRGFLEITAEFAPEPRRKLIKSWADDPDFIREIQEGLSRQCSNLVALWQKSLESEKDGNDDPLAILTWLLRRLASLQSRVERISADPSIPGRDEPLMVADLVYQALRRWKRQPGGPGARLGGAEALDDVQARIQEFLIAWNLGIQRRSPWKISPGPSDEIGY